jgi:hypothetical protein
VDDVVTRLRAQLDDDERAAEVIRSGGYAPPTWHCRPTRSGKWTEVYRKDGLNNEPPGTEEDEGGAPVALVPAGRNEHEHIARHGPGPGTSRCGSQAAHPGLYERVNVSSSRVRGG